MVTVIGGNGSRKKNEASILPSSPTAEPGLMSCSPGVGNIVLVAISLALFSITVILFQSLDLRELRDSCITHISKELFDGVMEVSMDSKSTLTTRRTVNISTSINGVHRDQEIRRYNDVSVRDRAWYLQQLTVNGTQACHNVSTASAQVFFGSNWNSSNGDLKLQTDKEYEVTIASFAENGTQRCSGGDYFEVDVNGTNWKSRPPIKDLGDGTYIFKLRVHSDFPGLYGFRIILLYPNWHGMELEPRDWVMAKDVLYVQVEFLNNEAPAGATEDLKICDPQKDYKLKKWEGRWTRNTFEKNCSADQRGRFVCLDQNKTCERPWCDGEVGRLESNGWVYSAHCAFRMFTPEAAWDCVAGKWLFFWGDSNHRDTIRNLLNFPLRMVPAVGSPDRNEHHKYTNPFNSNQTVTITNFFNGHYKTSGNNMGLQSLDYLEYRENLKSYFNGSIQSPAPDVVIMNSGLHDGNNWPDLASFAQAADNASIFWEDLWTSVNAEPSKRPKMVYRTTVAPAGMNDRLPARNTKSNVQKNEIFNTVLVDSLLSKFGDENLQIIDHFDVTFPWHYDHLCSDGPHYGRSPNYNSWIQGGHQYFTDIMLTHVLLNAVCPST